MRARFISSALALTAALHLVPTSGNPPAPGAGGLRLAAAPVGAFTPDFNPFDTSTPAWRDGVTQFIYEPLVEYDADEDDQYYPWLASSWTFSSSGQNVTFDIRPGIRWDDGSLLSAYDVAYTFNLVKAQPSLGNGLPVVSAIATGRYSFTLTLAGPAYSYLYQIAHVPIVKVGYATGSPRVARYVDGSPDGTGPYALAQGGYSASQISLSARLGYWQGHPQVPTLVFPALATRAAITAALLAGRLDWAQQFMPNAQSYVAKDPKDDHFWFTPDSCTTLVLNFSVPSLGRLAVRRAISNALDRSALSKAATGGYEPPATDASGLILPRDAQFLPRSGGTAMSTHSRPEASAVIMHAAGYHRTRTGYWSDAAGGEVTLDIVAEEGTPLATMARTAAGQLRMAGFAATSTPLTSAKFAQALASGHFDAAVVPGNDSSSPYFEYKTWFTTSYLDAKGRASGGDYERMTAQNSPSQVRAAGSDLTTFASSPPGSSAAAGAIRSLAALAAANLPVIPLVYDVAWGEYSTRYVQGWPDSADPYEPAVPVAPFAEYTVLQLSSGL